MSSDSAKMGRYLSHLEPLQGALEAYCGRHLDDSNATEDVLQETLAKTYRDFDLYREGTNFRAWIFRYLNLEILAWNRRYRRIPEASVIEPIAAGSDEPLETSPETLHEISEDVLQKCDEVLASAIRNLSEPERSVLLLRAIGEFKYREIAEILTLPVGTVMSHLSRARAKIRRQLQGKTDESLYEFSESGGSHDSHTDE